MAIFAGWPQTSALGENVINTPGYLGNGARYDVSSYCSLIGSRMGFIDTEIGDLE